RAGARRQLGGAGDVVGVHVGLERVDEAQPVGGDACKVAIDLFHDGINERGDTGFVVAEKIAVRPGLRIEQLLKYERHACPVSQLAGPRQVTHAASARKKRVGGRAPGYSAVAMRRNASVSMAPSGRCGSDSSVTSFAGCCGTSAALPLTKA